MTSSSRPSRLKPGDTVRFVSPASTPDKDFVDAAIKGIEGLGLKAELGRHVFDRHGYLAGRDADRLADLNAAFNDPVVRAVITTRGGKGAYRIADGLDFTSAARDPKLLVGFSEITILHLALWRHARLPGLHGACWSAETAGVLSADSFICAVMTSEPIMVRARPDDPTAALTSHGQARGILLGGNLDMIAVAQGWILPDLSDAILLIEDVEKGLGHIDRHLTRLIKTGSLDRIRGIALGQFTRCDTASGWTVIDVLRDRLAPLGVPILGGLPFGHGEESVAVPVGTEALLDADAGTLTVDAAVA